METLKQVLMRRDRMSEQEADDAIADARLQVARGADPEEVLLDDFGLEPDYFWELV